VWQWSAPLPVGVEAAIERARSWAAKSGELHPASGDSWRDEIPDELADFVGRVLSDGTYARAVERIGHEDPDLATI
jgi:hypothetical protein